MTSSTVTNDRTRAARVSTVLPLRPDPTVAPQSRRATRQVTRHEVLLMCGAGFSALCTTLLLFGRLTPLSGKLGFVVVGFGIFLATYAVVLSLALFGVALWSMVF